MRCRHHFRHREHDLRLDLVQIYPLDRTVNWHHDYHCEHLCHLSICFQLHCGQYVDAGFSEASFRIWLTLIPQRTRNMLPALLQDRVLFVISPPLPFLYLQIRRVLVPFVSMSSDSIFVDILSYVRLDVR